MLLVTNIRGFPRSWTAATGQRGESLYAASVREFLRCTGRSETVFLVNCDPALAMSLAAARWGRTGPPLVSVDLVLRRPVGVAARLALPLKRALLGRFEHHIHYFRDLSGLEEVFGIGAQNSSYVPFKPNLRWEGEVRLGEGDYVLCFGRSMRDYDTFFSAVEQLPYAAAIATPDPRQLRAHGARFTRPLDRLPSTVRLLADDDTAEAQIRILSAARLVVLPILKSSIVASGISTCLNAMLLGKCVIGSHGPGMSDILGSEALFVPPEDPGALAAMIREASENDGLRRETAAAGRRHALSLGGEPELYQRVIDQVVNWYRGANFAGGATVQE